MSGKKSSIVWIVVSVATVLGIIGYSKNQDQETSSQETPATRYITRSQKVLAKYNQAPYIQLQQLFYPRQQQQIAQPALHAIDIYNHTLIAIPEISHTLSRMERVYTQRADHDQAIAAYKAAVALNPSNPSTIILQRL